MRPGPWQGELATCFQHCDVLRSHKCELAIRLQGSAPLWRPLAQVRHTTHRHDAHGASGYHNVARLPTFMAPVRPFSSQRRSHDRNAAWWLRVQAYWCLPLGQEHAGHRRLEALTARVFHAIDHCVSRANLFDTVNISASYTAVSSVAGGYCLDVRVRTAASLSKPTHKTCMRRGCKSK